MIDEAVAQAGWAQLGEHEWARVETPCAVNLGLVIGDERALLIDTGAGPHAASRHLGAVRLLTGLPLVVVNTHFHHDHVFGNATLLAEGVEEVWGTPACMDQLRREGESLRSFLTEADGEPGMRAGEGPGTAIAPATRAVGEHPVDLDLGGHQVTLTHLGRGHTAGDLVVASGSVLFVGDLIEVGGPPQFEDAFPDEWLRVLGKIIAIDELYEAIVPGHGAVVDADEVRAQYHRLANAIQVADAALSESPTDATKSIPVLPFGPVQSRHLLGRLRETRARGN